MKNKLLLSTFFVSLLLISGCKKSSNSSSTLSISSPSSSESSSSYSSINQSSEIDGIDSSFSFKSDSSLNISLSAECATELVHTTKDMILLTSYLSDASVNHITGNVYTPSADGASIAKETSIFSSNFAEEMFRIKTSSKDVYSVASFSISFTIIFGQGEKDKGLYLDVSNCAFGIYGSSGIAKAYRIAFIPDNSNAYSSHSLSKVYAPLQEAKYCKYVSNVQNIEGTSYSENDLIDCNFDLAMPYAWDTRNSYFERPDFIGYFRAPAANESPVVSIKYHVVVWLEGTDVNLINFTGSTFDAFYSTLAFSTVDLPSA